MNPRSARRFLATHLEDANDDPPAPVRNAVKALADSPALLADYESQAALDRQARRLLAEEEIPDSVEQSLVAAVEALPVRRLHPRDPAILAAGIGFLLLVALMVWNFLGRPAAFPPDAAEIAEAVIEADGESFDPVGEPAGEVDDWFLMKGFDGYKVPEHLETHLAETGGILKIQNHPVAVVSVPRRNAHFIVFEAASFGIRLPEGEWRTARIDERHAAAVRQKDGMCFMILRKGSLASVQDLLGTAPR